MHPISSLPVRLTSGSPWHISCVVESIGPDWVCRIHGGDAHVGAVALSQWRGGRALTDSRVVEGHKEADIATHAARELCRAGRRSVVCIAGIHFDGIDREQIREITQAAHDLTRRAARRIERRGASARVLETNPAPGAAGRADSSRDQE